MSNKQPLTPKQQARYKVLKRIICRDKNDPRYMKAVMPGNDTLPISLAHLPDEQIDLLCMKKIVSPERATTTESIGEKPPSKKEK